MIKRVIVAGCRNYTNYNEAKKYINFCIKDLRKEYDIVFVSGGCKGADMLGERYAKESGFQIERYPAEWGKYGRYAGIKRNKEMAEISDYVICFWDGKSKGTKSLIEIVKQIDKPLKIFLINYL